MAQVGHPPLYVAARGGYTSTSAGGDEERMEIGGGLLPGRFELPKVDYELDHYSQDSPSFDKTFAIQFVATPHRSYAGR